jgi:integrase
MNATVTQCALAAARAVPIADREQLDLVDLAGDLAARAASYANAAKAPNTQRGYRSDWRAFEAWCGAHGVDAMPAASETVVAYLVAHAGALKVSTLRRRLAAIRECHRSGGVEIDTGSTMFRDTWKGIRRTHGRPADKRAPLLTAGLRRALATLPASLQGQRDRALLLIGFGGALRRSELARLEITPRDGANWIEETAEGLIVHLGRAKTDQEGRGEQVAIPFGTHIETCPPRAYRAWLLASGIQSGPAFRPIDRHGRMNCNAISDGAIARIVKRTVVAAAIADGMTELEAAAHAARFSGHSLRAGLATSAAANDAPGHAIQRQLRHRNFNQTAGYIRDGRLFRNNAAGSAGL